MTYWDVGKIWLQQGIWKTELDKTMWNSGKKSEHEL